jgi:3-hydroxyisobutyrate dehydrogenase-like beta-hydroxyacid dehydrogenase
MSPQDSRTRDVVALCGLGNMGAAVASRLVRHYRVLGSDLSEQRRSEAAERHGVEPVEDLAQLAQAPVVVLSLPTPDISTSVMTALLPELAPGTLVLETSTVNPSDMWRLRDLCAPAGVRVVDAAILSGVAQMEAGRATLLVGGADEDLAAVGPLLEALGSRVMAFGDVGSGMSAKVINNAVAHAVMVVLVEAGAMAAATGLAADDLAGLLADPDAGLLRPLTHRFVERVMRSDYEGGMPTEAARKDSTLALGLAQTGGVPLFAIQGAHTAYEIAVGEGLGRLDYAAIARLWEGWTGRPMTGTSTDHPSGEEQR